MAAIVLAVLLLEQKHCNLHLFQFDCWFIPPSHYFHWVSYLTYALLATSLVFLLLLNQNNRDLFRLGHADQRITDRPCVRILRCGSLQT